jgi:hypothetical protein
MNRRLGRVGKPVGSAPVSSIHKRNDFGYQHQEIFADESNGFNDGDIGNCQGQVEQQIYRPLRQLDPEV